MLLADKVYMLGAYEIEYGQWDEMGEEGEDSVAIVDPAFYVGFESAKRAFDDRCAQLFEAREKAKRQNLTHYDHTRIIALFNAEVDENGRLDFTNAPYIPDQEHGQITPVLMCVFQPQPAHIESFLDNKICEWAESCMHLGAKVYTTYRDITGINIDDFVSVYSNILASQYFDFAHGDDTIKTLVCRHIDEESLHSRHPNVLVNGERYEDVCMKRASDFNSDIHILFGSAGDGEMWRRSGELSIYQGQTLIWKTRHGAN